MKRLRRLAGIALIAGIFTGLTSCANKKGDLGAELDTPPIVAQADGARPTPQHAPAQTGAADAVLIDIGASADTVDLGDPKNRVPQSVSINRDTKAKPEADPRSGLHLPEAAQGEVVAIPVPVQPAPVALAKPEAVKAPTVNTPKDDAKEIVVKPDIKKVEPSNAVASATPAETKTVAKKEEAPKVDVKPEVKKVEPAPIVVAPAAPSNAVVSATPSETKVAAKVEVPKVEVKPEVKKVEPAPIVIAPVAPSNAVASATPSETKVVVKKEEAPKVDVKPEVKKVEPAPIVVAPAAPSNAVASATPAETKVVAKAETPKVEVKPEVKKAEPAPIVVAPTVPSNAVASATPAETKVVAKKEEAPKVDVKPEAKKVEPAPIVVAPAVPVAPLVAAKIEVKPEAKKDDVAHTVIAAPAPIAAAIPASPVVSPNAIVIAKPAAPTANAANVPDDDKDKGKEPPKPNVPPNETAEQRAARLLLESAKLQSMDRQAAQAEAEAAYQAGLRLFNNWEYEKAKVMFERALQKDPLHELALEKLRTVKSLLNVSPGMGEMIRTLEKEERLKVQQQAITLANKMEEARSFETRGSEAVMDSDPDDKIHSLSDRLSYLERAQDGYRSMIEIINWMPPAAELPGLRRVADEALTRVRGKIAKLKEEVDYNNREKALITMRDMKTKDTELYRIRIQKMLEHVAELYALHDYKGAEQMALRVLINDPMNEAAERWKNKARAAYHSSEKKAFVEDYHYEYRRAMQDVDEAQISIGPLIQYPSNWDQISKRSDVSIGKKVAEEPWKAEIRKRLQRKVTFEFADTPLADAIEFLRHLSGVTMIIDPAVLKANPPQINLRVTDMNLDLALEWILKLAELEYVLQDDAIYISKPQTLQPPLEMKIYDVSDLTQNIQDFPGPEFQITTAGDKTAQGAGGGAGALTPFQAAKPAAPTNATIQEMIKTRIRPDMWDPATGASIEEKGGKLVVMQRPEIHALIDQLLSNFRSTQKMMINIESRFLNIREAYLEQTGVEWQGLDPNVLKGDFGDLQRLAAPTGFLQPRVPASTDTSPPNIPFPGFVATGDNSNNTASAVGSIVNHVINFFPNDPDTISAQDTTNTVRQGGLSAQLTVLNNTQMQAFIRALAVRENSSTLVAPRLTVFNTQRASMFVARQQSYVADYEISGDSYDPVVRQFLVGVVLDVKPIVSSDRHYVTMELRPTVTTLANFVTRQIDTFSVNSGAQINILVLLSFPIQFPELAIQRVRTTATVPDGGIMLIGGLYKNIKFNAENGIPFLSDLPVVGRMFRWNVVDNAKTNLAILISPRIILFNEEEEKLLR